MRELERVAADRRSTRRTAPCSLPERQRPANEFLDEWLQPGVTRAVVQERLRGRDREGCQSGWPTTCTSMR